MLYIPPKYFSVQEFVPRAVYNALGDERSWQVMDERILQTAYSLRVRYGKMTINNWHMGGDREWSGLRLPESPFYSKTSQHSFGRAIDVLFADVSAEDVRMDIRSRLDDPAFKFITSIELGTSWLHADCRNCNRLMTYYPG